MKNTSRKAMVILFLLVGLFIGSAPQMTVYATGITNKQVQEIKNRNQIYRFYLDEFMWGESLLYAEEFNLIDINGDGSEELAVGFGDSNNLASALMTVKDGDVYWGAENTYYMCAMWYCPQTGYFAVKTPFWTVDETFFSEKGLFSEGAISIYSDFGDGFSVPVVDEEGEHWVMWDEQYLLLQKDIFEDGNYLMEEDEITGEMVVSTPEEKAKIDAEILSYMPTQILIKAYYENTEENWDKYLPLDEAVIRAQLEAKLDQEQENQTQNSESQKPEIQEPEIQKPEYTYKKLDKIMYAASSVNVRDLPSADGEKLGYLSKNEEIKITGQCKETGWYRIEFENGVGYVSSKYLTDTAPSTQSKPQEPETQEPETQESETQEPETQEPETQESETQEPETQESETQESETQEPETQESETQESETQESETQDSNLKKDNKSMKPIVIVGFLAGMGGVGAYSFIIKKRK